MDWFNFNPAEGDSPLAVTSFFEKFLKEKYELFNKEPSLAEYSDYMRSQYPLITAKQIDSYINDYLFTLDDNDKRKVFYYLYAIPGAFVGYKAFNVSDDVKDRLKLLLSISIKTHLEKDCFIEICDYLSNDNDYLLTNLLGFNMPKESPLYPIYWQQMFLKHFDEIFAGTYELGKEGNGEELDEDLREILVNFGPLYGDGWVISLEEYCDQLFDDDDKVDAACLFLKTLAESGDQDARCYIFYDVSDYFDKEYVIYTLKEYCVNNKKPLSDSVFSYLTESDFEGNSFDEIANYNYIVNEKTGLETIADIIEITLYAIDSQLELEPDYNFDIDEDIENNILETCLSYRLMVDHHKDEAERIFEKYLYLNEEQKIRYYVDSDGDINIDIDVSEVLKDRENTSTHLEYNHPFFEDLFYVRFFIKRDYDIGMSFIKMMNKIDDNIIEQYVQNNEEKVDTNKMLIGLVIDDLKAQQYKTKEDEKSANKLIEILNRLLNKLS